MKQSYIKIKYIFDYPMSLFLILIFLPILIIISIIIYFTIGTPIFFIQERVGRNKKNFNIIKFRTMKINSFSEEDRVTRFGNLLRKYKLDELPQFFNILRGEMTFIGPRPLLPEYNHLYSHNQNTRFKVKPGLTGLCQIKVLKNKKLSWVSKLNFDRIYVTKLNFFLDLYVLFETFHLITKKLISNSSEYDNFEKFKK